MPDMSNPSVPHAFILSYFGANIAHFLNSGTIVVIFISISEVHMGFLIMFFIGILAIILTVAFIASGILHWWGDAILVIFLIAFLFGLIKTAISS